MKIIIIGVLPSSLINFRGALIEEFVKKGFDVIAMGAGATVNEVKDIEAIGVRYIDYKVQRNGLNPLADFATFLNFRNVFKKEQPDIVLSYTIKPVIWGGLAARFFPQIKFFALITGLGFAFQKGSFKRNLLSGIVTYLYRLALAKSPKVVFQNPDNMQVFIDNRIIPLEKSCTVNGSGVDLNHFEQAKLNEDGFTFLTIARLLGEKGLREYAAAAKLVKQKYPNVIFQLIGPEDPSPDGISISEVKSWHESGDIEYLGSAKDVRPFIASCNVFVLASYHEGMPRTILEAMAIGRPILTTNVPGCRETVIDECNGFLVEKQNIEQLVDRMCWFIENKSQLLVMADKSYQIAVEKFDVNKINKELLSIMELT